MCLPATQIPLVDPSRSSLISWTKTRVCSWSRSIRVHCIFPNHLGRSVDPICWQVQAQEHPLAPPLEASVPVPTWQSQFFPCQLNLRRILLRSCLDNSISSRVAVLSVLLGPTLRISDFYTSLSPHWIRRLQSKKAWLVNEKDFKWQSGHEGRRDNKHWWYLLGTVGTISSRWSRSIERFRLFLCHYEPLTEDGGLASVVKPDDDDAHLLVPKQPLEQLWEYKAHFIYLYNILLSSEHLINAVHEILLPQKALL